MVCAHAPFPSIAFTVRLTNLTPPVCHQSTATAKKRKTRINHTSKIEEYLACCSPVKLSLSIRDYTSSSFYSILKFYKPTNNHTMFTCAARRCLMTMRLNTRGLLLHRFPSAAAAIITTTARSLPPSNAAAVMPQQERAAVEKLLDLCCAQQQQHQKQQKVNDLDRAGHAVQVRFNLSDECRLSF